jgi:regulator of sigma E protease
MDVLIKALQLIVSLSILVMVHEFGHFFFARLFKTRVEKFRLFFDPWFAIWKKKIGETEYGIGWLPLGGYVKISGMIDESMDKEQMKQPPQPHEFRSKNPFQRLMIMIGGVLFNIILAFIIYISVLWVWGEQYLPVKNMPFGIVTNQAAHEIGFRNGDKLISVGGNEVENFNRFVPEIILTQAPYVSVEREGKIENVVITNDDLVLLMRQKKADFFSPRIPFEIGDFPNDSPARDAGFQKGDKLVAFNGHPMIFHDQYVDSLSMYRSKTVAITVSRSGIDTTLSVKLSEDGKIGVLVGYPTELFTFETIRYNFIQSVPAGISKGVESIVDYVKQIKLLLSPETKAYEQLGGFIRIGSIFPDVWDWHAFWNLTAFLSIILAIMNILPIPALDGGHVVLLLYEIVTRRKPSEKFLEYAQITGMVILFALLIYANMNDVIGLFK